MGLLALGTPLAWNEASQHADQCVSTRRRRAR